MDSRSVREIVEQWIVQRVVFSKEFSASSAGNFVEVMNYRSKQLIREFEYEDVEFWGGLAELAQNAASICDAKARTIVDGRVVKP